MDTEDEAQGHRATKRHGLVPATGSWPGNVGGKGSSPSVIVDASVHIMDACNMLKDAMWAALARTDWVTHGNPTTNKVVLVEMSVLLLASAAMFSLLV